MTVGSRRGEGVGGEKKGRKRFVLINRSEAQMEKAITVFEGERGGEREDAPTAARTDWRRRNSTDGGGLKQSEQTPVSAL